MRKLILNLLLFFVCMNIYSFQSSAQLLQSNPGGDSDYIMYVFKKGPGDEENYAKVEEELYNVDCPAAQHFLNALKVCYEYTISTSDIVDTNLLNSLYEMCGDFVKGGSNHMAETFYSAGNFGVSEARQNGSAKPRNWKEVVKNIYFDYVKSAGKICGRYSEFDYPDAPVGEPYRKTSQISDDELRVFLMRNNRYSDRSVDRTSVDNNPVIRQRDPEPVVTERDNNLVLNRDNDSSVSERMRDQIRNLNRPHVPTNITLGRRLTEDEEDELTEKEIEVREFSLKNCCKGSLLDFYLKQMGFKKSDDTYEDPNILNYTGFPEDFSNEEKFSTYILAGTLCLEYPDLVNDSYVEKSAYHWLRSVYLRSVYDYGQTNAKNCFISAVVNDKMGPWSIADATDLDGVYEGCSDGQINKYYTTQSRNNVLKQNNNINWGKCDKSAFLRFATDAIKLIKSEDASIEFRGLTKYFYSYDYIKLFGTENLNSYTRFNNYENDCGEVQIDDEKYCLGGSQYIPYCPQSDIGLCESEKGNFTYYLYSVPNNCRNKSGIDKTICFFETLGDDGEKAVEFLNSKK